ncbi:hypothetical protein N7517_005127 [Penicillium concentricum]|uniref:Uncharacterized protein n=1 Tax=Penicillium concentricum TaxID=293559 RepID=A0A9W9VBB2_9EURO|nr:uncharacterized protein N7517_005127 [Penicillium concentricum]KAJ5373121.1 hypothetical protein N7517_005127 [Penicillium concentricum]
MAHSNKLMQFCESTLVQLAMIKGIPEHCRRQISHQQPALHTSVTSWDLRRMDIYSVPWNFLIISIG